MRRAPSPLDRELHRAIRILPSPLVFRRRRRGPATSTRPSSSSFAAASTSGSSASTSNSSSRSSSQPSSSSSPSRPPWRLGSYLSPPLALLAASLEGAWHANLTSSGLELVELDPGVEYRDSAEEEEESGEGQTEPEPEMRDFESVEAMRAAVEAAAAKEAARLAKLEKTRLVVENRVYSSTVFRKIHLELALRGDGLQVLHCVLFPRLEFDLPILSMDLVAAPPPPAPKTSSSPSSDPASPQPPPPLPDSVVSLAIIDPCPARLDGSLPEPLQGRRRRPPEGVRRRVQQEPARVGPRDLLRGLHFDEAGRRRSFTQEVPEVRAEPALGAPDVRGQPGREPGRDPARQDEAAAAAERAATAAAHARYREKQLQNGATRGCWPLRSGRSGRTATWRR